MVSYFYKIIGTISGPHYLYNIFLHIYLPNKREPCRLLNSRKKCEGSVIACFAEVPGQETIAQQTHLLVFDDLEEILLTE